jgi:hypothetical protein
VWSASRRAQTTLRRRERPPAPPSTRPLLLRRRVPLHRDLRLVEEARGHATCDDRILLDQPPLEPGVGGHAADDQSVEGGRERAACGLAIGPVDDQLRDHRVVVGEDRAAGDDSAVPADVRRDVEVRDRSDLRCETCGRVLGVDPRLERVTGERDCILRQLQRRPSGDRDLQLDEVHAGDCFRHGVLDLQPGVHLEEVGLAGLVVHDELDRADRVVLDRLAEEDGGRVQSVASLVWQIRAGASSSSFW